MANEQENPLDAVAPNPLDAVAVNPLDAVAPDVEEDNGRLAKVGIRGANIGLSNLIGAPGDIIQSVSRSPIAQMFVGGGPGIAPPITEDIGSENVQKIFRHFGFIDDQFAPETPTENVVSRTGEEIGALAPILGVQLKAAGRFAKGIPRPVKLTPQEGMVATILKETAEAPGKTAALEAGLAATAGGGAGAAAELFPDSPIAEIIGGLLGVMGPMGAGRVIQRFAKGGTPKQVVLETASQGKPVEDVAGNINLNNFDTTDQSKELMRQTAADNAEFINARRGEISLEQTEIMAREEIANDMNIELREVGEALNAEELTGARIMLAESAENVVELSARVASGQATVAEIASYQATLVRHAALQAQISGATAEAGRALSALRITARTEKQQLEMIDRLIKEGGGEEGLRDLAGKIGAVNDPAARNKFIADSMKPKMIDKVQELWINSLLSGPQTHVVNMSSNTLTSLWQMPERMLAAGFSKVGSKEIQFSEVPEMIKGWIEGAVDGTRLAKKSFVSELPSRGQRKIDVERPSGAISGTKGRIARLPGRALLAEDEFFKSIGYRMELNALATRQASKEGLRGTEHANRVFQLKNNPTPDMIDKASFNADYITFTKKLGPAGQKFIGILRDIPALRFITPFVRTPVNIVKFAIERTPAAPLMKSVKDSLKKGGAARELALSRIALGTAMGGATAYLAGQGLATGSGPSDPDARRVWLIDRQPSSIKVGDKWVSYGRIEPLGIVMGLSADIADIMEFATDDEKKDIAGRMSFALAKNLTNKTFLSGLSDMLDAVNDPERFGERFIQNLAGTVIPTGVAQITRNVDPVLRDVSPDPELAAAYRSLRGIINKIKSRVPGLSEDLPARIDLWGNPIVFEGGLGPDIISPLYTKKWKNDKPTAELLRLDVIPGALRRDIGGAELKPEEFKEFSILTGKTMRGLMEPFINNPSYDKMTDIAKEIVLKDMMRSSRDFARSKMLTNDAVRNRVIKAQKEKANRR